MKKLLLLTVLLSVLVACSGRQQIEKALYAGNYDTAISTALKKLDNNKDKKRKQQLVIMLEDAYQKVMERDLNSIEHLKKDGNPEQFKTIYSIYMNLNARQEAIKPILPLKIDGKNVRFMLNDYSSELVDYRYKTSDYLIDKGINLLDDLDKYKSREAYAIFKYIEQINPNFEENRSLMDEAREKGKDFVIVDIENRTHQIIPQRLEDDLLNFDAYELNQFWTQYHAHEDNNRVYDYAMQLQLKRINISPEKIYEKQLLREKTIVDGWEYQLDNNGNVMHDSLGNDIKVDKVVNVRARYFKFNQFKSTQVIADIVYTDLKSNQTLDVFAIDSEFIFDHYYATFRGDRRALHKNDRHLLNNRREHFPTNAQMVYDTGEDLKLQLKEIINSYRMRR